MARRRVISTLQASFPEAMLLGIETEQARIDSSDDHSLAHEEKSKSATISPSANAIDNLFSFISALVEYKPSTAPCGTAHQVTAVKYVQQEESQPSSLPITAQWLLDHYPDLLTRLAAIWNAMRESERLPSLANAEHILAPQLAYSLSGARTNADVEAALLDCCGDLETLAHRLYCDVSYETKQEISRCVDVLMQNALRQPYEDEGTWIRQAMEAAVRRVLAGQSNRKYSALIISTLQRPFRDVVRQLLQANELPFPERVLALALEKGYANTMRTSLQTLARLGLTAQTATLAWEAARSGQTDAAPPWMARRADGCAAAILDGYATVDQRVIRYPGYALLATFDAERRVTHQMTIETAGLEEAKQSLWAQGYYHDDEGFPLSPRVVQLWCDFCHERANGWWLGDEAGRVMVVIPYVMRRRLGYHKPLCRAVEQMQTWGYRFRVDDHTLYFLPAGVDLPIGVQIPDKEIYTTIEE